MGLHALLASFLAGVIYPVWLLAGGCDYLFHRMTAIERTSGATESWYHLAQFAALAIPLLVATLLAITPLALAVLLAGVVLHTALAIADVRYTMGLRQITALEQHAHGFMTVLPAVAVGIVAVLNWDDITSTGWVLRAKEAPLRVRDAALLVGSYFVLAGGPIVEELIRCLRGLRDHQVEHRDEGGERHQA